MSATIRVTEAFCAAVFLCTASSMPAAEDWPMLGRDASRNAVSSETEAPLDWTTGSFDRRTGEWGGSPKNVRWWAGLGVGIYASPVISDGLVWIGANSQGLVEPNDNPAALLRCYRESDGKLLYEYVSPRIEGDSHRDPPWHGMSCSPSIHGDRLWFCTNRCETVCLDITPLKQGVGNPRVVWKTDLKELRIYLRPLWMWPGRISSPTQPYEGRIYVTVPNGTDDSGLRVPAPEAPSLVCLNADTGDVVWTDNSPGANMLYSEFSSPLVASIGGRGQVVVAQGDGWMRSFDPASGELLWKFDVNRKSSEYSLSKGSRNYFLATPVLYEQRIYIASGRQASDGEGPGRLVCLDPTKTGDISDELAIDRRGNILPHRRRRAIDPNAGERAIPNPNSGLIWEFTADAADFKNQMHRTLSTVAIQDDLVIASDYSGLVHCLGAHNGRRHWSYDALSQFWGAPLIVGNIIYAADQDGVVSLLRLSSNPELAMDRGEPIARIEMSNPVYMSPVFANGTLYICDNYRLYAIADGQQNAPQRPAGRTVLPDRRAAGTGQARAAVDRRGPRSVFVPTPQDVVDKMLEMAEVKRSDHIYDLGSGDGRIVITAARKHGSRATGYEIDRELVAASRAAAVKQGVGELVTIEQKDIHSSDLSDADVVAVYLWPEQLEKLIPRFSELPSGARIVSHYFKIPGLEPDRSWQVRSEDDGALHPIYLWTAPLKRPKE